MSVTLCSEHGWNLTPIKPIFFAPLDIQPGGLTEELQDRLQIARNLIVICSPNSAKSEWVGKEIEFFHQLGCTKQIHFFIVNGEPHSGNPDTGVCKNQRIYIPKTFKSIAQRGKFSMGWFFGFNFHLICNEKRELLSFMITPGDLYRFI